MPFTPRFSYTHATVQQLGKIEAAKSVINLLPLPPDTSLRLRHDALQRSTHSSTQIEGNPLSEADVRRAIAAGDRRGTKAEQEVRNYWRALNRVEEFAETYAPITEKFIRELHRIVIVLSRGRRGSRSDYRIVECPVVDTVTRRIDYGPPAPNDVPELMTELVAWLNSAEAQRLPVPVRAAILTHRFLSIHPFGDGNGRTGRLLATTELWRSSYRMRGFFSFDEYFNRDRDRYYRNLQMGLPVDFYEGRNDPDHTPWVSYFIEVMAQAAGDLEARATSLHATRQPEPAPWERLPRRQQQILTRLLSRLLENSSSGLTINASEVDAWFGISSRTAREWLKDWAEDGFVAPRLTSDTSRVREYELREPWIEFCDRRRRSQR
ncbi:MAG: Fic family protein [Synechococcales cyanobacterium RU_4_20]|nr:Fic family protein [Synechococcales cyanobacterium RU_4_20]